MFWLAGLFTGLILALIAVAVLGWLFLRSFAADLNPVVNPLLERFVGPGSRIDIGYFNRNTFHIDELVLKPDDSTELQARSLTLTYDLSRLSGGDLDSLSAETIQIRLSSSSDTEAETASDSISTDISLPLLSDLMALPIASINLPSVALETPDLKAQLAADLNPELWWLRGEADIPEVDGTVQLDTRLQRTAATDTAPERADLLLMVSQQQTLLAQLWGGITQTSDTTSADLRIQTDLPTLQQRLPTIRDLPVSGEGLTLTGQLSSSNEARWPQQLTGSVQANLNTARSTLAEGIRLSKMTTDLNLEHPAEEEDWLITLSPGAIQVLLATADSPVQTLSAEIKPIKASCRFDFSGCELSASLTGTLINGTLKNPDYEIGFSLKPDVHWQSTALSNATAPLSFSYQQPATEGLPPVRATGSGQLQASLTPEGDWSLTIPNGLSLQADGMTLPVTEPTTADPTSDDAVQQEPWSITPLSGSALTDLTLSGNLSDTASMSSSLWEVSLNTMRVSSGKQLLRIGKTSISCQPDTLTTARFADDLLEHCQLSSRLLPSDWDIWPVPDAQLSGPFSVSYTENNQALSAALNLTAANEQIQLRTRLQHDLLTGEGSLQWHLEDATLDWNALGLSEMANLTMTQLLNGQLSGQGWVDWTSTVAGMDFTPDVMLRADNVSLIYNNLMTLDKGNVLLALRRPEGQDYLLDAQVSAEKVDNGITLSNILARSQTRMPADFSYIDAEIYEMHTDVLGGRVYTPLIRYDSRKEVNAFGIRLDHIQLTQIAELEAQAGVSATGLLDGMLPVVLTKEGPSIPGGTLFARDPGGVVKYLGDTANALSKSNQGTGMAMKLLSDFRYELLQSGVQYQPDGQLNLALKFEGHNPDFFDGQKTLLNVNLEYNLLDLLESLRLSNDVIQKLEDKYQ